MSPDPDYLRPTVNLGVNASRTDSREYDKYLNKQEQNNSTNGAQATEIVENEGDTDD
jgi:hypothetical protein